MMSVYVEEILNAMPDLATVAALIADPARATMLSALLDNIALPAGELARLAKITPQTASAHLAKLIEGGLLNVTPIGRHRYFRLKNKDVARVLESLALIAPPARVRSLNDSLEKKALYRGRTCYDHLAGELGVGLTQAFSAKGIIEQFDEAFAVTPHGKNWFAKLGIDCLQVERNRRAFAPICIDWSERKPHIAGALGAALTQRLFTLKWIARIDGSRAVRVTNSGYERFKRELDFNP
ncbi:MAG: ArsR family transcriptional regulator [Anaerolineales bacterium]|nr:ArsR family transcriptional regulator [Anaerolineales bacterium]